MSLVATCLKVLRILFPGCYGRPIGHRVLLLSTRNRGHLALDLPPDQPVGHHTGRQLRADGVTLDDVEAALFLQQLSRGR